MSKVSKQKDIEKARGLLEEFIELSSKPGVRNDPVIKTMLRGLLPANSPFETASMAVATLRNAGCLDSDMKTSPAEQTLGNAKVKAEKKKQDAKPGNKSTQKLRGFDRSVDVLLEDAVYRKVYPDKESHPVAIALRKLRADPGRLVEVKRLQAVYEEVTYPNGKKGKIFKGLAKDESGKPVIDAVEKVAVKDIGDLDLLASENAEALAFFTEEYKNTLFSWADAKSVQIPDAPEAVWPSLKATTTLGLIEAGEASMATLKKALAAEKFSRFGPSPTLYFKDYLKYQTSA